MFRIPSPNQISTVSRDSIGSMYAAFQGAAPASVFIFTTANQGNFYPFVLSETITVRQLWIYNAATVAGNVDVGIYDAFGNRIVSSGSVASAGANQLQVFDVTDTVLAPGRYFFAVSISDTAIRFNGFYDAAVNTYDLGFGRGFGVVTAANVLPLPATVTFAQYSSSDVGIPIMGLSQSTVV